MQPIIKAFSFQGRTGRAGYWKTFLWISILMSLVWVATIVATMQGLKGAGWLFLLALPLAWANVAVAVRRLHDRNKSAWWIIPFGLLPVGLNAGAVAMAEESSNSALVLVMLLFGLVLTVWGWIEIGFLKGAPAPNRYGAA